MRGKMKLILLPILVIGVLLLGACVTPTTSPPTEESAPPTSPTTEEPAPPSTSTPTPEPTPPEETEPTPPPAKPEIKGVTTYSDESYFYIVGELLNTTNSNINFVKVVATFYDEAGTVIGTNFTYTELDIIMPNNAAPFEISSYPDKIKPASYKLDGEYNTTGEQPFTGLSIKSYSASIDDMGYYKIVGEVKNTSTMSAEFVKIIATYYNSSEEVLGTAFTYTDIDLVEAGGTAPFELSSYPRKIKPASYNLQVQGSEH